ncbi:hypothetical protein AUP74_02475 [Microbulbifer aggregans]|uniref:DUF1285 domain-containing protein n=1 Tax=Microbulbifer aggregans TaxID=1769779 RepID=A0A1C9W9N6_9GAMM|nr:DUF1285 domain-containing protein [Microbulbifer aggregans]AOS97872.1 hypothetical protein AUP74_02475 [Microbulbifer aggregans]
MAEPLFEHLEKLRDEFSGHPPVHKWDPDLCGDMDLTIRRDGTWVHEGTEIQREALVRLFASILRREGDEYFLVTPVEKWRIHVEDVPFLVNQVARGKRNGTDLLLFTTNTGDVVPLVRDSGWSLRPFGKTGQPVPYIEVRDDLWARVSRDVYYQLVDWAIDESKPTTGDASAASDIDIVSDGERFPLGSY